MYFGDVIGSAAKLGQVANPIEYPTFRIAIDLYPRRRQRRYREKRWRFPAQTHLVENRFETTLSIFVADQKTPGSISGATHLRKPSPLLGAGRGSPFPYIKK